MIILLILSVWIFDQTSIDLIEEGLIRGEELIDFPSTLPYAKVSFSNETPYYLIPEAHPVNIKFYGRIDSLKTVRVNPLLNFPITKNIFVRISPFLLYGDDPAYPLPKWKKDLQGDFQEAGIIFNFDPLYLTLGRMRQRWGVTEHSLILSGWNYPYDHFGFRFQKRPIQFSYFHARLERLTGGGELASIYGDTLLSRFLVGHRLEVRLNRKIHIGFTETCVYANPSGIDISFLNPLLLYYEVQWNKEAWEGTVDDNILWSFDIRFDFPPTLYFELLLDDYQYEPPSNREPNEIGFTAGVKIPVKEHTISLEYTRLNDFCYNTAKPYLRYVYMGQPLGYYHGPDVDDLRAGIKFRFVPFILKFTGMRHRKGEGRFDDPWPEGQFPSDYFLTGVIEQDLGLEAEFKLYLKKISLSAGTGIHWFENYHNRSGEDKTLPIFSSKIIYHL